MQSVAGMAGKIIRVNTGKEKRLLQYKEMTEATVYN